jgi:putative transposase
MNLRPNRRNLLELVEDKNRWCRPLTAEEKAKGFLGWHQRGYLPHCDFPGLVQLVTVRLADSMPASRRHEWEHLLEIEDVREKRTKLEDYLDRGIGACHLRNPNVAKLAVDSLLGFHGTDCQVHAWCVMPNHFHMLLKIEDVPLSKIMQRWKSFVASEANAILRRHGRFWEPEYWDTFMRDDAQEKRAVRYIENNPIKARICRCSDAYAFSSAQFRDAHRRLQIIGNRSGAQSSSSA